MPKVFSKPKGIEYKNCQALLKDYTVPVLSSWYRAFVELLDDDTLVEGSDGFSQKAKEFFKSYLQNRTPRKHEIIEFLAFFLSRKESFWEYLKSLSDNAREVWKEICDNQSIAPERYRQLMNAAFDPENGFDYNAPFLVLKAAGTADAQQPAIFLAENLFYSLACPFFGIRKHYFVLDEDYLIFKSLTEDNSFDDILKKFADPIGEKRYKVSPETFMRGCDTKRQLEGKIKSFKENVSDQWPPLWVDFFAELQTRFMTFKNVRLEGYAMYQLPAGNQDILRLIVSDENLKKLIIRVEDFRILIKKSDENKIVDCLKAHGYLPAGFVNLKKKENR